MYPMLLFRGELILAKNIKYVLILLFPIFVHIISMEICTLIISTMFSTCIIIYISVNVFPFIVRGMMGPFVYHFQKEVKQIGLPWISVIILYISEYCIL